MLLPMSDQAYLPRHLDALLAEACAVFPIVMIDGARGVGKTTSAARLAGSVVSLPSDLARLDADPEGYLASLTPPVLIDEWQLAGTDLLWTLKRAVDADPTPGRFLLAGSVEPATYGPTFPLTGRAARLVMRPMTVAEWTGRGHSPTFLDTVVADERPRSTSGSSVTFDIDWLGRAGFPATRLLPDSELFLESYAALVAQRAGDEGRDAARLLTTMRVLATLEAQAVPDRRVWESADVNKVTWKAYEDLLARTHLSVPSPAFDSNRVKRLTRYPKRYLADTALSLSLAGLDVPDLVRDPTLAGRYVESFAMQQLRPQVDAVRGSLSHLRTGAGEREIDAIVEVGIDVHAFEVKYGTKPSVADARHLAWLRDELGDRFRAGFVVHTGGDAFPLGDRLWALPLDQLCGATP